MNKTPEVDTRHILSREWGLKLIGHNICPYVQRVVMVMLEKGIPFERTNIDLDNKPSWLKDISPTGKVPILVTRSGISLFESSVICDYLDDVNGDSLYSDSAEQRAHERAWISYGNEVLSLIARMIYQDQDMDELKKSIAQIRARLAIVEGVLGGGPYFNGQRFSVIDAVYATLFRYFEVFDPLLKVDTLSTFVKMNKWSQALARRQAVVDCVPSNYGELLRGLIRGQSSYLSRLV